MNTKAIFIGAVLAILGFLAGWSLRPAVEAPPPGPGTTREAPAQSRTGAGPSELRPTGDSTAPPELRTGDGAVVGSVRTRLGEPVGCVRVTLTEPESDARREAMSDGDGAFAFQDLPDASWVLEGKLQGWSITPRKLAVRTGARPELTASRVARARVRVLMPDGSEPASASVLVLGRVGLGLAWTPEEPFVELAPGTYRLSAWVERGRWRAAPQTVTLVADAPPCELTFEVEPTPEIRGRITWPEGEADLVGQVRLVRLAPDQPADPALLSGSPHHAPIESRRTDGGEFTFGDVVPGRYLIGVTRRGSLRLLAWAVAEATRDGGEATLEVPPLRRDEYAVVRVLAPDGALLRHVTLTAGHEGPAGGGVGPATVVEREGGVKWVLHSFDPGSRGEGVRCWIEASTPAYGRVRAEYEPGAAVSLELRYEPASTLAVRVPGLSGTRYEGRVFVALTDRADVPPRALDRGGNAVFEGLEPGAHTLAVSLDQSRTSWLARRALTLAAGETREVEVELPPLFEVTLEGLSGSVSVARVGGRVSWRRIVSTVQYGQALVDGLPAGEYEARSGSKSATFTLPGAGTVCLR